MASRRTSSAPEPWPQYEARTTFLRVPSMDWAAVRHGSKTEFRATGRAVTQLWNVKCPTPVVGYRVRRGEHESAMFVLEATWREPLAAISDESLEREGFPSMAHFRRYWMERHHTRFRPMSEVQVYRLRPLVPGDVANMGLQLIHKLYGEHLPS